MNRIEFGPGLAISRLGFGCASVMGRVGARQGLDAMARAFERGVTHFDIARSYGFGDAERVLGRFIADKRGRVTVTSKFGVVPTPLRAWQRIARPLARPVLRSLAHLLPRGAPGTRARVSQVSSRLLAARRFDLVYARECLGASLRALGTDHLDFYLLHEPALDALHGADELRRFLDDSVRSGQIRAWGLAHPVDPAAFDASAWGRVLQFESALGAAASCDEAPVRLVPGDDRLAFVTRPLAGGLLARPAYLNALAPQLGLDDVQLAMALACAAAGTRGGVIAGMFDAGHIEANVRAVEHWDAQRDTLGPALAAAGCAVRDLPGAAVAMSRTERPAAALPR